MGKSEGDFEDLFADHRDEIYRYCLRRVPRHDALDAVAEVFLTAWRRLDRIPPGGEARLWLFGVARNVVRNHERSRRRRLRLREKAAAITGEGPLEPDTVVVRRSEEQDVVDALSRLSLDDREVLRLKVWDELGHADIGAILGISPHAVDMRVRRALVRLGRELDGSGTRIGSLRMRAGER